MQFKQQLVVGRLKRRYQRFLAEVVLADGASCTVHCPNSGSMRGCLAEGNPVRLSRSDNPGRKYPFTLEMIEVGGVWVGVNTGLTNRLVREALENGVINAFGELAAIRPEIKVSDRSRLDFLLTRQDGGLVYLEVKNCTLAEHGVAMFPDAVTARGAKHLVELMALAGQGHGAAVLFCVQRSDAERFAPAGQIDPHYAAMLAKAAAAGVKVLAWQAAVTPGGIRIHRSLPVICAGGKEVCLPKGQQAIEAKQ